VVLVQPHIATDGRTRSTGARPDDHPGRYRKRFTVQLREHRLGNVVIAAPIGGSLGVGELIEVVPAAGGCKISGDLIDRGRIVNQLALATVELDELALLAYGRGWHDGHERQVEQSGEVGLADCGRPGGRLDQCGAFGDPVVAQAVQHQRPCQSMLQAAGRMHRLVLQIQVDAPLDRQRIWMQMSVGAAIRIRLYLRDRPFQPGAVVRIGHHRQITGGCPARVIRQIVRQRSGRRSPARWASPI